MPRRPYYEALSSEAGIIKKYLGYIEVVEVVRGKTLCIMPSSTTECGKLEPVSGIASGELRST